MRILQLQRQIKCPDTTTNSTLNKIILGSFRPIRVNEQKTIKVMKHVAFLTQMYKLKYKTGVRVK